MIRRVDPQTVVVSKLEPLLFELLQRIPASADPTGSEAACDRLFSSPSRGAVPQLDEEWKGLVEPELRELFQSAIDVIQADLKSSQASVAEGRPVLRIPVKHLESWIHGLNQARLTLVARHAFTDRELESGPSLGGNDRALTLFQVQFYGLLQEFFLHELDEL